MGDRTEATRLDWVSPPPKNKYPYIQVEQSDVSEEWLVLASPPGTLDYRSVFAGKDKDEALEVASRINDLIALMPLKDWNERTGKYLEMSRLAALTVKTTS